MSKTSYTFINNKSVPYPNQEKNKKRREKNEEKE